MAKISKNYKKKDREMKQPNSLLPKDRYLSHIIESEMKDTESGGEMLALTWEVLKGKFKGRKFWSNLNLKNDNEQTEEIAHAELDAIHDALGFSKTVKDSKELHKIACYVDLYIQKSKNEKYKDQNRASNYLSVKEGKETKTKDNDKGKDKKKPWDDGEKKGKKDKKNKKKK